MIYALRLVNNYGNVCLDMLNFAKLRILRKQRNYLKRKEIK